MLRPTRALSAGKYECRLHNLWLESGTGGCAVDRHEVFAGPPLRGKIGLMPGGEDSASGEVVMAADQDSIRDRRQAGYTVINLKASYTLARSNLIHMFSGGLFNAGDRLYRNHLSFIKDLAPEIGRGVRFTYTLRFF